MGDKIVEQILSSLARVNNLVPAMHSECAASHRNNGGLCI